MRAACSRARAFAPSTTSEQRADGDANALVVAMGAVRPGRSGRDPLLERGAHVGDPERGETPPRRPPRGRDRPRRHAPQARSDPGRRRALREGAGPGQDRGGLRRPRQNRRDERRLPARESFGCRSLFSMRSVGDGAGGSAARLGFLDGECKPGTAPESFPVPRRATISRLDDQPPALEARRSPRPARPSASGVTSMAPKR